MKTTPTFTLKIITTLQGNMLIMIISYHYDEDICLINYKYFVHYEVLSNMHNVLRRNKVFHI